MDLQYQNLDDISTSICVLNTSYMDHWKLCKFTIMHVTNAWRLPRTQMLVVYNLTRTLSCVANCKEEFSHNTRLKLVDSGSLSVLPRLNPLQKRKKILFLSLFFSMQRFGQLRRCIMLLWFPSLTMVRSSGKGCWKTSETHGIDVAYQDVLNQFDSMWCVKGLIVTHSNLVVA